MAEPHIQEFDPEALRQYMASHREREYTLLDVRQHNEYETEHIPGSRLLPLPELEERLDEIAPDKTTIVYCHSGSRSMAAAVLLASSGRFTAPVFSLMGGIAAWDGKILEDTPRIKLFADCDSLEDLLFQAMDLEKGAFRFYESVLKRHPDIPFFTDIGALSGMERRHARAVYQLWQQTQSAPDPFDQLFDALPGEVLEGGQTLEEALTPLFTSAPPSCLELAEIGLDIEYRAYDLYRTLAHRRSSDTDRKTLLVLSEQEKGHIRILARGLAKCP